MNKVRCLNEIIIILSVNKKICCIKIRKIKTDDKKIKIV